MPKSKVSKTKMFRDFSVMKERYINNNYLKKTELTNAAVAWNEASPVDATASMESEASSDEAPESSEEVTADVPCPVCGTGISVGSVECPSCGYTLEA